MTIRLVGESLEEFGDEAVYSLGLTEWPVWKEDAFSLIFSVAEPDREGSGYSLVVEPGQRTAYQAIVSCELMGPQLRLRLTEQAAAQLGLPVELVLVLGVTYSMSLMLERGLARVGVALALPATPTGRISCASAAEGMGALLKWPRSTVDDDEDPFLRRVAGRGFLAVYRRLDEIQVEALRQVALRFGQLGYLMQSCFTEPDGRLDPDCVVVLWAEPSTWGRTIRSPLECVMVDLEMTWAIWFLEDGGAIVGGTSAFVTEFLGELGTTSAEQIAAWEPDSDRARELITAMEWTA